MRNARRIMAIHAHQSLGVRFRRIIAIHNGNLVAVPHAAQDRQKVGPQHGINTLEHLEDLLEEHVAVDDVVGKERKAGGPHGARIGANAAFLNAEFG